MNKQNILWQPQPKQRAFMERPEFECLYGGAAGGGKSDALVEEALRQVHIPHYKGLLLRRTYPQLSELIDKTLQVYDRAFPGAKYNDSKHIWKFPSGPTILTFSHIGVIGGAAVMNLSFTQLCPIPPGLVVALT